MIVLNLTLRMIEAANVKAERLGKLRNSILSGAGNIAGYVGQDAILAIYSKARSTDTYDYDVSIGVSTFEVKTKQRTVKPRPTFECAVPLANPNQATDFYMFVSLWNFEKAYLLGYIKRDEFFKLARIQRKGDLDQNNGFVCKADCYSVKVNQLNDPEEIFKMGIKS